MLTIYGSESRFCDGVSRRNFLKIGALALGGLTLPELLRAEAQSGIGKSHKAVIMIFLPGGPSHQDMFDLKQDAPSEIRGEFKPIATNVSGIQICEHMPRIAGIMDKLTVIRSIVGAKDNHDAFQCMTGHLNSNQPPGGWPSLGSVVSKLQGPVDKAVPSFIGLAPKMGHMEWAEAGARCVTLAFSRWDHHGDNFGALRQDLPLFDQGLSALVEDLHQRGLDKDVSVVVWGEFGRTPTINKDAGRDHWPRVSCAVLAGGGMKTGQVIGVTDRLGGEVTERPVQFGDVFASLYHNLGIDVTKVTVNDLSGRPQYLVDSGCQPLRELS